MKIAKFLTVCLLCLTIKIGAATSNTRLPDFAAPIVNAKSNYTNAVPFGTILYDNTDQAFVGLTNEGTWTTLAQSNSNLGEVRVNTGNGHGGSSTKVRRFTNTDISTGSDITYADSASNGGSFTINTTGIYSIHYSDLASSGPIVWGVSLNASSGSTGIESLATSQQRAIVSCAANNYCTASITLKLTSGDVIRAHTDGGPTSTSATSSWFHIVRVR